MLFSLRTCLGIAGSIKTTFYPSLWFKNKIVNLWLWEFSCFLIPYQTTPRPLLYPWVSQTPLSSSHQICAGDQRLGSSSPHWSLNTTYLVIWEALLEIEIVQGVVGRWIYRETCGHTRRVGSFERNVSWAADWMLFSHASVTHSVTRSLNFLIYKRGVWIRQSLKFLPTLTFCNPRLLMLNLWGFIWEGLTRQVGQALSNQVLIITFQWVFTMSHELFLVFYI